MPLRLLRFRLQLGLLLFQRLGFGFPLRLAFLQETHPVFQPFDRGFGTLAFGFPLIPAFQEEAEEFTGGGWYRADRFPGSWAASTKGIRGFSKIAGTKETSKTERPFFRTHNRTKTRRESVGKYFLYTPIVISPPSNSTFFARISAPKRPFFFST